MLIKYENLSKFIKFLFFLFFMIISRFDYLILFDAGIKNLNKLLASNHIFV